MIKVNKATSVESWEASGPLSIYTKSNAALSLGDGLGRIMVGDRAPGQILFESPDIPITISDTNTNNDQIELQNYPINWSAIQGKPSTTNSIAQIGWVQISRGDLLIITTTFGFKLYHQILNGSSKAKYFYYDDRDSYSFVEFTIGKDSSTNWTYDFTPIL